MEDATTTATPLPESPISNKKCFTVVQQRRFWTAAAAPPPSNAEDGDRRGRTSGSCSNAAAMVVTLCPSMDVMAYGLPSSPGSAGASSSSSSSLQIYRTLHWQKIAQVVASTSSSSQQPHNVGNHAVSSAAAASVSNNNTVAWRPDGRFLAVAEEGGTVVSLYSLEGLLNKAGGGGGTGMMGGGGNGDETAPGRVHTFQLPSPSTPLNQEKQQPQQEEGASSTVVAAAATITALSWHHVGNPHPSWPAAPDDDGDDDFWTYRSKFYVDREAQVLPPSDYHVSAFLEAATAEDHHYEHSDSTEVLPTCQTPLSVLCVATDAAELHLFLHGRYRVATIPIHRSIEDQQEAPNVLVTSMLATTDLVHYLVTTSSNKNVQPQLTIYSVPALSRNRYDLQTIACSYCKMVQHIAVLRNAVPEIAASWKSSLKAVDLKLDGLRKLLSNYGLLQTKKNSSSGDPQAGAEKEDEHNYHDDNLRALLVQYILSGHTRSAPNLSNAIDQFFTSTSMNDQLVQRMERTLTGGISNVETTLRRRLRAPAQALAYEASQLSGLAAHRSDLLPVTTTARLVRAAHACLAQIEHALSLCVEARFRLRDLVAWARSVGATIKARGTAANSVQRQNALKRRVPEVVVQRVLGYLREEAPRVGVLMTTTTGMGTTESVLGLRFAAQLSGPSRQEEGVDDDDPARPESPASVVAGILSSVTTPKDTTTIPATIEKVSTLTHQVFEYPQSVLAKSISQTQVCLESTTASPSSSSGRVLMATTTRVGQGGMDVDAVAFGEAKPEGFFAPSTTTTNTANDDDDDDDDASSNDYRQWCVTATAQPQLLQLRAFPLTWTSSSSEIDSEADTQGIASNGYWTTCLKLASDESTIREIAFYGDDGKSSLSSGVDSGTGQERRQALGLVVSRFGGHGGEDGDSSAVAAARSTTEKVELWMVPYDDLEFVRVQFESKPTTSQPDGNNRLFYCKDSNIKSVPCYALHPTPEEEQQQDDAAALKGRRVVYARTRPLAAAVDFSDSGDDGLCRLVLSGSRGIGAVFCQQGGGTAFEVLDLEEDEEEEEEEEGDDDDDEVEDMEEESI